MAADEYPVGTILSENEVPEYTLPNPLINTGGKPVLNQQDWVDQRRPEIMHLFEEQMFGRVPGLPIQMEFLPAEVNQKALGGLAARKQIILRASHGDQTVDMHLLLYIPNRRVSPAPVFLGLNFHGNHAIHNDSEIFLSKSWMPDFGSPGISDHHASEASRGSEASRWQVERVLERGYALASLYYGEIDPDYDDGFQNGIHPLFYEPGQRKPEPQQWGAIAAWAWGLSRALDYLETDGDIDAQKVSVLGHSRLGKTALWAGARDTRFALVISNNSGCGGAALSRRRFGETVELINQRFPHWFCGYFKKYNGHEEQLPFDQHMLIALIAPRPVYVASAAEDLWADPKGEYLSAVYASPVYQLLGKNGLPENRSSTTLEMPGLEQPLAGSIGYHIRRGKHDVTAYDWERFLDFADQHLKR